MWRPNKKFLTLKKHNYRSVIIAECLHFDFRVTCFDFGDKIIDQYFIS